MKNKIKETALNFPLVSYQVKSLTWTIGLIAAAIAAPAIFAHTPQNQWLTGTLVNATLFLAAYKLAPANALLVAFFPSTVALTQGLLPLPMALLIPYIITSNIILMLVFGRFKKRPLFGVIVSSLAKFSFLYVLTLIIAERLNFQLISMLQWPQLFTALAGGMLAITLIKIFTKKNQPTA